MKRSRTAVVILSATLALATPALAACGGVAEQAAEKAVEAAGGGDVDIDNGNVTVTDESGNAFVAGENVTLPDNWPSAVPAFDGGTLSLATVQADGTAGAMWIVDGSPEDAAQAYGATLEAAGFTQSQISNAGGMSIAQYDGNGFTVGVTAVEADGKTGLTVSASPTTS